MNAVAHLQRSFQRYIYRPDTRFEREVVSTTRLAARERLGIYANAYRARLVEALGKDYPGLKALAGKEAFDRIARAYIETHPSPYANLRWYGGGLAAFLRKTRPWRRRTALAEMAAFEWALGLAFDAADEAPLGIETVSAIASDAWPRMRLTPHSSVWRVDLHCNVPALRAAADGERPLPALWRRRRPVAWLIWRKGLVARFRSLQRDEARALDMLLRGKTFGAACERLARTHRDQAPLRAASLLKGWLNEGLFAVGESGRKTYLRFVPEL